MKTALAVDTYDVFVSYGRNESKSLATRLKRSLEQKGYRVWLDQDDIELGVDFQERIDEGIAHAHNFVYLIAPHAIQSKYCRKEIEVALHYNKRIIPILHVERNTEFLHPKLAELNWLYMREEENQDLPLEAWNAIDDFESGVNQLTGLLDRGKKAIERHTQLLMESLKWDRHHRSSLYLPVGRERESAESWLKSTLRENTPCLPSLLHCEYIAEARKNGENMMTDVFITYDQHNKKIRSRINHSLLRHGFTTWVDQSDIKAGVSFEEAIFEGIEQADNLVFLLSKDSIRSEFCLKELAHALSLNKRIIPLMVEKIEDNEIPEAIRTIQYIDFSNNNEEKVLKSKKDKSDYERDVDELIAQLHEDEGYILKHKQLLVQSLRWESLDKTDSILLRGFNLEEAESWLKTGLKRRKNRPISLQKDFITASKSKVGQLKTEVFVSYSRKDADFARKINSKLQVYGKTTWFDQESIAEGSDFEKEIFKGIESSDNFLFIISPDSIGSEFCEKEVLYAAELNKRFIPIVWRSTEEGRIPSALKKVQWIDFEGKDFESTFGKLVFTIDTDRDYVQSHTQWQSRASEWIDREKSEDLLLRGKELEVARAWLEAALNEDKQPPPTGLHQHYIHASEEAKLLLLKQEEERKKEMDRILQEKREEEIKRLEKEKASRKQRILIYFLLFLFLATVGLSLFAYRKSKEASEKAKIAQEAAIAAQQQKKVAQEQREEAYIQKLEAERQKREADRQRLKVDSALGIALAQKKIAEFERQEADSLRGLSERKTQEALWLKDRADKKSKEANEQRKLAEQNAEKARNNAKRLEEVSEALSLVSYMAEKSLSVDDPTTKSLVALHARKIHQNYQGPKYDPDIYSALYDATKAVNGLDYNIYHVLDDRSTITSMQVSDNEFFITGYDGSMTVWGWNSESDRLGKKKHTYYTRPNLLKGALDNVFITQRHFNHELTISTDKQWAALANEYENSIFLYKLSGKKELTLKGHKAFVSDIVFSSNNDKLYASALDGTVRAWSLSETSGQVFHRQAAGIRALAALPNGQVLMLDESGQLIAKSSKAGDQEKVIYTDSTADIGTSLAMNTDGSLVAAGFASGKIVLFHFQESSISMQYLYGHKGMVKDIIFSNDGSFLASVSLDGKVLLRHMQALENKPREMHDDNSFAHSIAFSPNNHYLLVSNQSKIRAYPIDMDMMAKHLCEKLNRNQFSQSEWEKFGFKKINYENISICE